MPDLADELKLREGSKFHSGLTAVAHKDRQDVCWNCFEPLGTKYVDLPMGEAWVRICDRPRCERKLLKEPREPSGKIWSSVPAKIKSMMPSWLGKIARK